MTRDWHPDAAEPLLDAIAVTPHLLVALDFDGTAAPLVDEPMSARALPAVRAQVDRLAALPATSVAYVSGRSLVDLRVIAEHDDDSKVALAGSHGAEFWFPADDGIPVAEPAEAPESPRPDPATSSGTGGLTEQAAALVAGVEGAWVEPKAHGFALHTRLCTPDAAVLARTGVDALMAAEGWRRRLGKDVLEFSARPEGKDTALALLRERCSATAVLFAGDDITDEDAQRSLETGDLGIRVGQGDTHAHLRIEGPGQLAVLLERLTQLREHATATRPTAE